MLTTGGKERHSGDGARHLRKGEVVRTIDRTTSMLLVVDFQSRLMPVIAEGEAAVANAKRLLDLAEMLEVPVVVTEQNPKGLGHTVPELGPSANAVTAKMTFDACREPGFADTLPDRPDVVVAGCEAHVCVLQTVLGLLERGAPRLRRS